MPGTIDLQIQQHPQQGAQLQRLRDAGLDDALWVDAVRLHHDHGDGQTPLADGVPDEVGVALLRATGLYPPGSFVEMANGERGIVVARGRRANLPWVASLVAPCGMALGEPALRDTIESRFAVRGSRCARRSPALR